MDVFMPLRYLPGAVVYQTLIKRAKRALSCFAPVVTVVGRSGDV